LDAYHSVPTILYLTDFNSYPLLLKDNKFMPKIAKSGTTGFLKPSLSRIVRNHAKSNSFPERSSPIFPYSRGIKK
jgi:hypothetical protein